MSTLYRVFLLYIVFIFASSSVHATEISLEDWAFNIDGTVSEFYNGDALPATGGLIDGLGSYSLSIAGEGDHSVIGFFDFEMFENFNTFFNESASIHGSAAAGQSWEVDEPGYVFGDIYDNVLDGSLDNDNAVSAGFEDDVSFAIGWNFSLLASETATIDFFFTDILPTADFFIAQHDPDLDETLYFYSSLNIDGSGTPSTDVSEPSIASLFMLAFMFLATRKKAGRAA